MLLPPLADYASSRRELLALAESEGATLEEHRHPLPGPDGGPLATDVARFGAAPGEARAVVVVTSGLHGVEGHAGSGLQTLLMEGGRLRSLPAGVAVVLVHAANPYGMAWSRRVDHDNIDVNRNFVDFATSAPSNEHYARISPVLNPTSDTLDLDDRSWTDELSAFANDVGALDAFRTISGGQYDEPHGVQFGGGQPAWSRRTLESIWSRHLARAAVAFHLDIHTGLGPWGAQTIFQTADTADPTAEVASAWFPTVLRFDRPAGFDPIQAGVLGPGLDQVVTGETLAIPVVVEFGTLSETEVLAAMRADNWLHAHHDPLSATGESIRARTRDAFYLRDEGWRSSVAEQGLSTIDAALDAACDHPQV